MNTQVNTGRYSIDQELYAVALVYRNDKYKNGFMVSFSRPFSWGRTEQPAEFKFIKLAVKSHHKVAWDQDPDGEKKYDGYLLESPSGVVFENQYPRASYGQVSDAADRIFTRQFPNGQDYQVVFANEDKDPYEYSLISEMFDPVFKAVTQQRDQIDEKLLALLDTFHKNFIEAFEKEFPGKTLEFKEKLIESDFKIHKTTVVDKV